MHENQRQPSFPAVKRLALPLGCRVAPRSAAAIPRTPARSLVGLQEEISAPRPSHADLCRQGGTEGTEVYAMASTPSSDADADT